MWFFLNIFLIGGKLLYNVVLVSAIQYQESVIIIHTYIYKYIYIYIYIYISLLGLPPLPSKRPSWPLFPPVITECQARLPMLYSSFLLAILHMIVYICQCSFLNSFHPLLPLLCPQVHSLCLCFYAFLENRFISTIFLDSRYMH